MTQKYKYLHFVDYSTFLLWDIKRYFMTQVSSSYPIVRLGDYIQEESAKYKINDPSKTYGILGVNNQTGIFDAYREQGSNIKQKYKKMQVGWIAYNPYRVNVGSIGMHTDKQNYEYISPAYVVFSCKEKKLSPEFLYLLMKTDVFNQIIRENTTGSVRQNLNYSVLSNLQIPLPSLDEQNNIVAAYNSALAQSALYARQAQDIDAQIEAYLQEKLGFNVNINKKTSLLNFVNYIDLSRWDPHFLLSQHKIGARYPLLSMGDVLSHFLTDKEGKSLRRETTKVPQQKFQYIGMENIEKNTGRIIDSPTVNGSDIKSQTMSVPNGYFLYGKLRPYLNKYWYNNTLNDNIVCSSELFVFDIKENIMNKQYFLSVLASCIVQKQLADAMSGARMPRITEDTFRSIQIPLPPLDIQNEIVSHITSLRTEQKALQQQSLYLRLHAQQQFVKTIFN